MFKEQNPVNPLEEKDLRNFKKEAKDSWKKALEIFPILRANFLGVRNPNGLFENLLLGHAYCQKPIPFLAFWGVGGKGEFDANDQRLFEFYQAMLSDIEAQYPQGGSLELLLADVHGKSNGFDPDQSNHYLAQVGQNAQEFGWNSYSLAEIYRQNGLGLPQYKPGDNYDLSRFGLRELAQRQLIESAQRHNHRDYSTCEAAALYCQMRVQEAPILEQLFPGRILVINGSRDFEPILPKMAIGYADPLKGGGPSWFKK